MRGRALFDSVVRLCGISTVLAPGIVRRALLDEKIRPEDAEPRDYEAALPRLAARLTAYLSPEDADKQVKRIAALLAQVAKTPVDEAWSFDRVREAPAQDDLHSTGERLRPGAEIEKNGTR